MSTYDDPERLAQLPAELRGYIPTRDIAKAAAAEIERLRSGVNATISYIEASADGPMVTLLWVTEMLELLARRSER